MGKATQASQAAQGRPKLVNWERGEEVGVLMFFGILGVMAIGGVALIVSGVRAIGGKR